MDSSISTFWTGPFPIAGCLSSFFFIIILNTNSVDPDPVLYANSENSDQTERSVASDLSLHCLQMSLLYDARDIGCT